MFHALKNMKPATVTKLLIATAFVALPLLHMNCAPTNAFSKTESTSQASADGVVIPAGETVPVTDSGSTPQLSVFETTATIAVSVSAPLDLVWVIDNSGSMTQEAANVRKNFDAFIATLSSSIDLKLALISKSGTTGENVTLSVNGANAGANFVQINQKVESKNPLQILASAICPLSAIMTPASACGIDLISKDAGGKLVQADLVNFLRPASRKVFVIATDDNSTLSSDQFLAAFRVSFPSQTPTVYAFAGLGKTLSPNQAATGVVYKDLALATGGGLYNVGDADWSSSFAKLASNVIQLTSKAIPLPASVINGAINTVEVNGKLIDSTKYVKSADGLHLDASVVAGLTTVSVRITYIK